MFCKIGFKVVGKLTAEVITSEPSSMSNNIFRPERASRFADDPLFTNKQCLTPKKFLIESWNLSVKPPLVNQPSKLEDTKFEMSWLSKTFPETGIAEIFGIKLLIGDYLII